jgi:hypothetical protein
MKNAGNRPEYVIYTLLGNGSVARTTKEEAAADANNLLKASDARIKQIAVIAEIKEMIVPPAPILTEFKP